MTFLMRAQGRKPVFSSDREVAVSKMRSRFRPIRSADYSDLKPLPNQPLRNGPDHKSLSASSKREVSHPNDRDIQPRFT